MKSSILLKMPFHPYKDAENYLEGVSRTRQTNIAEGGDTDIERGQSDADESSSFLDRKLKDGERHSRRTRFQRSLSVSTPFIVTLVPWVINFILTIALVSLSWETASSRTSTSHQPPMDLMYSEYSSHHPRRLNQENTGRRFISIDISIRSSRSRPDRI
jgi:hypothetical protein